MDNFPFQSSCGMSEDYFFVVLYYCNPTSFFIIIVISSENLFCWWYIFTLLIWTLEDGKIDFSVLDKCAQSVEWVYSVYSYTIWWNFCWDKSFIKNICVQYMYCILLFSLICRSSMEPDRMNNKTVLNKVSIQIHQKLLKIKAWLLHMQQ